MANSTDIVIDGVTVMHATGWDVKMLGLKRVHINRLKVIAWR
eukprot:SAG22_NODE_2727_length_2276_cov_1.092329_4_plen_41_part_01